MPIYLQLKFNLKKEIKNCDCKLLKTSEKVNFGGIEALTLFTDTKFAYNDFTPIVQFVWQL